MLNPPPNCSVLPSAHQRLSVSSLSPSILAPQLKQYGKFNVPVCAPHSEHSMTGKPYLSVSIHRPCLIGATSADEMLLNTSYPCIYPLLSHIGFIIQYGSVFLMSAINNSSIHSQAQPSPLFQLCQQGRRAASCSMSALSLRRASTSERPGTRCRGCPPCTRARCRAAHPR